MVMLCIVFFDCVLVFYDIYVVVFYFFKVVVNEVLVDFFVDVIDVLVLFIDVDMSGVVVLGFQVLVFYQVGYEGILEVVFFKIVV